MLLMVLVNISNGNETAAQDVATHLAALVQRFIKTDGGAATARLLAMSVITNALESAPEAVRGAMDAAIIKGVAAITSVSLAGAAAEADSEALRVHTALLLSTLVADSPDMCRTLVGCMSKDASLEPVILALHRALQSEGAQSLSQKSAESWGTALAVLKRFESRRKHGFSFD